MLSHYLNQCCVIFNWTLKNKLQSSLIPNSNIFINDIALENIVCEMAAILSREDALTEKIVRMLWPSNWTRNWLVCTILTMNMITFLPHCQFIWMCFYQTGCEINWDIILCFSNFIFNVTWPVQSLIIFFAHFNYIMLLSHEPHAV